MPVMFYLLQLISPSPYSTIGLQPPVETYEVFYAQQVTQQQERVCLARILLNEASGETVKGKRLIAQTTLNRVASGKFSNSVCGVMKDKGAFSFYNPKSKRVNEVRRYPKVYLDLADDALNGKFNKLISKKVLYFKRCDVYNKFFEKLVMVKKEKNHCFYRENDLQLARR